MPPSSTTSPAAWLKQLAPDAALRAWMGRYAAFIATKRGMAEALHAGWASGRIATPRTRERIAAAIARTNRRPPPRRRT